MDDFCRLNPLEAFKLIQYCVPCSIHHITDAQYANCGNPNTHMQSAVLRGFMERLYKRINCSPSCYIAALIYLDRIFRERSNAGVLVLDSDTAMRLMLVSLTVACKFLEDCVYANSFYANLGEMSTKEFNHLEVEFLRELQFDLVIENHTYNTYILEMQNHGMNCGLCNYNYGVGTRNDSYTPGMQGFIKGTGGFIHYTTTTNSNYHYNHNYNNYSNINNTSSTNCNMYYQPEYGLQTNHMHINTSIVPVKEQSQQYAPKNIMQVGHYDPEAILSFENLKDTKKSNIEVSEYQDIHEPNAYESSPSSFISDDVMSDEFDETIMDRLDADDWLDVADPEYFFREKTCASHAVNVF